MKKRKQKKIECCHDYQSTQHSKQNSERNLYIHYIITFRINQVKRKDNGYDKSINTD